MPNIDWRLAVTEIATILTGVAITAPLATDIKRVYTKPSDTVSDFPSLMIAGTAKGDPQRAMSIREREYTVRLRLFVKDADLDRAADIIDAFQEAIIDRFDINLTLNGKVSNLHGPQWLEAGQVDGGGQDLRGCDALVRFSMTDDPTFGP